MSAVRTAIEGTWQGMIQRRLWPVALLLLVALVAVPLLLLAQPDPAPVPAGAEVDGAAELVGQPLVAVASGSDRDRVRRVLGNRKDPFKPSNQPKRRKKTDADSTRTGDADAAASSKGAATGAATGDSTGAATGGSTGSGTPTDALPAPSGDGSPAPPASPAEPESTPTAPSRPAGSLTVRWGAAEAEELEAVDLERLDPLPSPEAPVLVYLGVSHDGERAVFLVDAGVTVEGDARCRPSPDDCQTFELRAGETEFIEVERDGGENSQFQLDLVRIHGRKAERARAARRSGAAEAAATRRALRSLGQQEDEYRFDARTGTLELIGAGS